MTNFVIAAISVATLATAPPLRADEVRQAPRLVRVFVQTDDSGDPEELAARRTSVKDLSEALAGRKKSFVIVKSEDEADLLVEIVGRGITIPKVVFGIGPRPGDPAIASGPARAAELRARAVAANTAEARSAALAADFKNKNRAADHPRGWKSAADDIASQIEKWALEHRAGIVRGA